VPSGLSIDLIPCLLFLSWALDLFHWSLVLSGVYLPLFFLVCRSTKAPALLLVRIPGRPAARAGPAAASSRHKGGPASCGGRQQSERCPRFGLGAEQGSCLSAQAGAQATAALVQQGKQQRTVQGQQGTATALVFLLVYL